MSPQVSFECMLARIERLSAIQESGAASFVSTMGVAVGAVDMSSVRL